MREMGKDWLASAKPNQGLICLIFPFFPAMITHLRQVFYLFCVFALSRPDFHTLSKVLSAVMNRWSSTDRFLGFNTIRIMRTLAEFFRSVYASSCKDKSKRTLTEYNTAIQLAAELLDDPTPGTVASRTSSISLCPQGN